ncbi:MAG: primary-amine oxidase [Solirubrobacterales bacterium]|nr:primary-amine oxidase [Solirubrobacterales bacterium]
MPRRHPLDPLTADEIRTAAAIVRDERGVTDRWRFAWIDLKEPPKGSPRDIAYHPPERQAEVVCWNRDDGAAFKGTVSLDSNSVISWEALSGDHHPPMTPDEFHDCDVALRTHPEVIRALHKRGITDMDLVLFDTWAYGAELVPKSYRGMRIAWADVWHRNSPDANPYANMLSRLHPIVDLNTMELLELEDDDPGPAPHIMGEYAPGLVPGLTPRQDIRPLDIAQPDGPSFTLDGNHLKWQRWSMRIGFNYREGLVIHALTYDDRGHVRKVAHRMSFAEMVVPYRDPSPDHYRRTAFDIGEWGLGLMTTSLELGCDCLGEIAYLDAVLHDSHGEPHTIKNAICIHEEDDGVLWKHVDDRTGAETRRMRRLVVSFHATVANYEYLVYWRFYQDGNIQCEVRATGIMVTTPFPEGDPPPYGTVIDDRTYAPFHQHFIVARLDLDVDGERNTVYATEATPQPSGLGDNDPYKIALTQRSTPLRTEQQGIQDYDWQRQRAWKIVNDNVKNRLGTPVGYKLEPAAAIPALLDAGSPVVRRARAIEHTLWVTPYKEDERWPCGEFPNLSAEDSGLPRWAARDREIENTDVVLWYVFGINHVTRPEDWPVMPVDTVSFWLKPFGFFDRNPALDVPAQPGHGPAHPADDV